MQYLYIIKCQQYYKIGIAQDVESRLAQLSTGNPFPLEVQTVYKFENAEVVERSIHQRYKETRQRGEWFLLDYDALKNIHTICLMLGGRAFEYTGAPATEELIDDAEEIQENSIFEFSSETMRTELRMNNGEPISVVVVKRGLSNNRNVLAVIRKSNPEFEKYLELYKQDHPNSKVLK